jgi:preprotein translocase subunit SecA
MTHSPDDLVQRKHNYAIVDEVDSVIDDKDSFDYIWSSTTGRSS